MTPPTTPSTKTQLSAQYQLVQTSLLGGASAADGDETINTPNSSIAIQNRRARILPLAGAACYPILVEAVGGARRWVYDSTPVDFDGDFIRIVPQSMAHQFGRGAVQVGGGMVDANVVNALYPKPTTGLKFVAGSVTNSAGYVGGLYAIESGSNLGNAPGLTPPYTWCASYQQKLPVAVAPPTATPLKLPEFINRGTAGTGSGGIGALGCAFLGCGEGVIRHQFARGSAWSAAHVLYKWYLDPFSGGWTPGGSLNIGPGGATAGSIAIIEETINLQLPTWLYLEQDVIDAGGDVLWTATITRGGR